MRYSKPVLQPFLFFLKGDASYVHDKYFVESSGDASRSREGKEPFGEVLQASLDLIVFVFVYLPVFEI